MATVLLCGALSLLAGEAAAANLAVEQPLQIGFELPMSRFESDGSFFLAAPGLTLGWTFRRYLSAGIQGLTFGSSAIATGDRSHFGLTPYVENFRFVSPTVQLYGQLGLGWQSRSGAGLPGATGIAPMLGGGVRGWLGRYFSFGVFLRFQRVLSSGWMISPRVLPGGATIMSLGFNLELHVL